MKNRIFHKKIFRSRQMLYFMIAAVGFILGGLIFHSPRRHTDTTIQQTVVKAENDTIWTCSMHPQIRMNKPGKCPICGMDLIPVTRNNVQIDANAVHLTPDAAALANVMTSVVTKQKPVREIRLYGKIMADERLLQSQVAYIPGRIEKLYVDYTGESVRKGQPIALVYSPALITAQQELIEASRTKKSQPQIYEAAREKLLQWKITENQIDSIEDSGNIRENFEIVATTNGIVTDRLVSTGQYVSQGTQLFTIADLSRVWIMFDAYESDLPFIRRGEKVTFSAQAFPGKDFSGTISFIDPVIDPMTRVAKVRVEYSNSEGILKPEMFVTGIVTSSPVGDTDKLVIPASAVLWTGKRSIVYVKQPGTDEPVFRMREIELGPSLGESYVVDGGLMEGEEIVTRGTFSVDAAAQLEGKPSMMNPKSVRDEKNRGMQMPGMVMPSDEKKN